MAPKLKVLSGKNVIAILARFGFIAHSINGSHVKLRRSVNGRVEMLIVPDHDSIARGTLKAIFNQASAYIPSAELREHFYTGR